MGSSGGGGSSGRTDYPTYMKGYHQRMLGSAEDGSAIGDDFSIDIVEAFNSAANGVSPYFSYTSSQLQPDTMFFPAGKTIADSAYAKPFDLLAALANFDFESSIEDKQVSAANTSWINALIASQTAVLDNEITTGIAPKFHSRMRDIGAVMGSAFVIGDVMIQDGKQVALAKTRLDIETLALQREELAMKVTAQVSDFKKVVASLSIDFVKYYHAIRYEAIDNNSELVAKDLLWDLKLFQYVANPLGAISGSALQVDSGKGSKTGSAVGGTLSGAAAGAMIGSVVPGIGTAVGALAGGALGLAGGLF